MSQNLRLLLHKKILQALHDDKPLKFVLPSYLRLNQEICKENYTFTFPIQSKQYNLREKVQSLLENDHKSYLDDIKINQNNPNELIFICNKDNYIKGLVDSIQTNRNSLPFLTEDPANIVVEYSSPNIAKPFHVGHLRSTIIGNYIANINEFFKNNVQRINYLGDWGTQFGFVNLGLSEANISEDTLKKDPIKVLYNAYVYANKLFEKDPTVADRARNIFKKLENGDENILSNWEIFRRYTLDELDETYKRIGIKFDKYEWESMYSIKEINNVIDEIQRLNLLTIDDKNRKVVKINENRIIPIVKSDGSSLYITRDIAAAINRFENFKFDNMYYVVENGQTHHFENLKSILREMKLPWADKVQHIKFGKIRGMSTRKGTVVFLKDILDETKAVMKEKQIKSPNTRVDLNWDEPSTEILGISAVIINDLKHKRNHDYDFNWDKALDLKGKTGVKLQYTHCRLVSLEENSGASIASECIPSLLTEPAAQNLIYTIGKFDEALIKSYKELEPYILVNYLFDLSAATGTAITTLKIKGEPMDLGSQRLLLMNTAKKILGQGMKLLGLKPLDKM